MKFRIIFLASILFWGFSLCTYGQDFTSRVDDLEKPNEIMFELKSLPDEIINEDTGHYHVFLNYGDGNYHRSIQDMGPGETYEFSHTYQDFATGYSPTYLLIDRKTTNPPPPPPPLSIGVTEPITPEEVLYIDSENSLPNSGESLINHTSTMIDYTDDENYYRRLAIDHSHFLKNDKWSAFILGYRPIQNGAIFLFFDEDESKELFFNNTNDAPTSNDYAEDEYTISIGAKYGNISTLNGSVARQNAEYYQISESFPTIYDEVLRKYINTESSLGSEVDENGVPKEVRLFHYLKARDVDIEELEEEKEYKFLAILTSTNKYYCSDTICPDSNWVEDSEIAGNYVKQQFVNGNSYYTIKNPLLYSNPPNLMVQGDYYYIDAEEISVRVGDPKDPNEIRIDSICGCGDGTYKVSFDLQYCNVSPVPTRSATIYIKDPQNIFSCYTLPDDTGNVTVCEDRNDDDYSSSCNCEEDMNKCDQENFGLGMDAQYCVGEYAEVSEIAQTIYGNQSENLRCRNFKFTAQIDQNDLYLLWSQEPYIEACVNFHETECELVCSLNEPWYINRKGLSEINIDSINANIEQWVENSLENVPQCQTTCRDCNNGCGHGIGTIIIVAFGIVFIFYYFKTKK